MDRECTCSVCGAKYTCDKMTKLCHDCRTSDRNLFNVIRDYLYAYPGASINQVTDDTGISSSVVLKYLREGRLQTVGEMKVLNCEQCGVPINYGRLCEDCEKKKTHGFTSMSKRNTSRANVMHTKKKKN